MPVMESSSNLSQSMDSVNTVPGEEEVGQEGEIDYYCCNFHHSYLLDKF